MKLPPNQQLISTDRWPVVGERSPRADSHPWTVRVDGEVQKELCYTLPELQAEGRFEIVQQTIDIHCVTRWSKIGMDFKGIRIGDLLEDAGTTDAARFVSFHARSDRHHSTSVPISLARESLIAFEAEGRPLTDEHGGPVRVVVPGRYFYKSLKWLERIELIASDQLGYWESDAGYHNEADPWKEQRYIASSISKAEAAKLIASADFSGRDLRGLDCSDRTIVGLIATDALLRDARFANADLHSSSFRGTNLSNAVFDGADLRNASFEHADVEGASFVGADLRGANLGVASLFGASFGRRDDRGRLELARIDAATNFNPADLECLTDEQLEFFRLMEARYAPG